MSEITLGQFFFERLHQLGINTVFGLPGDFNFSLLDKMYEVPQMKWAGNANELNAAYAADGYSRIKGLACLITTFGVGELSALNGIGGAYAEHVGLIHVVGVPSIASQARQLLLHHTLGNGDFTVFHRMSNNISQTTAFLSDITTAPHEIDRCIRDAWIYQRPVYIALPANLVDLKVPIRLLQTPINLELNPPDPETQLEVVDNVLDIIRVSMNPVILVDACCQRHQCTQEVMDLINITQYPVFTTPMGKSAIDESHPRFGGVYMGTLSQPSVKQMVDSADLIISVGALLSDFNTNIFQYSYTCKNIIEFNSDYTKIKQSTFPGVQMKQVLSELLMRIASAIPAHYTPPLMPTLLSAPLYSQANTILTQEHLWNKVSDWFREGDIIVTETGTSAFGIVQSRFPTHTVGISQVLWGSIGFGVGATVGAALAARETNSSRRVILFVGDGALQLTVQEILTLCKWECNNTYLFVLNNEGYTIDRLVHGGRAANFESTYNDIQPWNILQLLPLFNAKDYETARVLTTGELDVLFADREFATPNKIRMIEVMLPRMDGPANLVAAQKIQGDI